MYKNKVKILNGNELIVQGALEAGFSLLTGYPGSPLADYFNILYKKKDELKKIGVHAIIANSEANAAAMASGAKMAGRDVLVAMKSMGLHVASDALSVGNFSTPNTDQNIQSAVVIVVGDDPWSMSTSTPADSRYLFKHLHIPFLEPSNPKELKDWIQVAKKISKESSVYIGILVNTFLAEGGGRVEVLEHQNVLEEKIFFNPENFNLNSRVMVPPNSLGADIRMIEQRFPKLVEVFQKNNLDKIFGVNNSTIGIISSGTTFELVSEIIQDFALDSLNDLSIYKVASSYPLVQKSLVEWIKSKKTIIVVEEKRGFLEDELKSLLLNCKLSPDVFGKKFGTKNGFVAHGGLTYEIICSKFKEISILKFNYQLPATKSIDGLLRRLPTFCPGCPHRETLSLLKDLRKWLLKKDIKLISHGDVGCYSLAFLPPFNEMHDLSAMGQGGALAAGMDIFSKNPSVVLMGDSTFFHSGMADLSNSVQLGHNITYILLDNDNTAMTGHQMTPASGISVDGEKRPKQSIEQAVKSLGVDFVTEVNPSDRNGYFHLLQENITKKGVKVIISNKECALTFHGRKKNKERELIKNGSHLTEKVFYRINTESCEDCRQCVELTGCPGLTKVFDSYGTKMAIDQNICVGDSYCTKLKACPSFEKIIVTNFHPSKYKNNLSMDFSKSIFANVSLVDPSRKISFADIANGEDYRIVVTGVGGSGITTISRVLAEAAKEMEGRDDIDFKFFDQKGLAQRNGNVTSHLSFYQKGKSKTPITPDLKADVILSPDLLDVCQHIHYLKKDGMMIVDENFQFTLNHLLSRDDEYNDYDYKKKLLVKLKNDGEIENLISFPLKDFAKKYLGKAVYSNTILLGILYQSGMLPFDYDSIESALLRTLREEELQPNLDAFKFGRFLFLSPNLKIEHEESSIVASKSEINLLRVEYENNIKDSYFFNTNKKKAVTRFNDGINKLNQIVPTLSNVDLYRFISDQIIYDMGKNLDLYFKEVRLFKDKSNSDVTLVKRGIALLTRSYFIKDEVFVAAILSSHKSQSDRDKEFLDLGSSFNVEFINRPKFEITKTFSFEFDIASKLWMFHLFKYFRFLRILPFWHTKEKTLKMKIRKRLIELFSQGKNQINGELSKLEQINGYREVMYEKFTSHY